MEQLSESWTRGEVEAELASILRDPEFERNPSVSRFLTFVVTETLEGRGARLKAFTVAVEVFGRDETFDAQSNSIVRVQAARLRQLLEAYYAGPGADHAIRIDMPVGAYRIVVSKRAVIEMAVEPADAPEPPAAAEAPTPPPPRSTFPRLALALGGALALLAALLCWPSRPTPEISDWTRGRPTLAIRVAPGAAADPRALARVSEGLSRALAAFDSVIVTRLAPESRAQAPGAYALVINAPPSARAPRISIELLHNPSGAVVWTGDYPAPADEEGEDVIVASASRAVADIHGAVNMDMVARNLPWPARPRGYLCILATLDSIVHRTPSDFRRAFNCLEADIAADPESAYQQALLSVLLVRRYLDAAPGNLGAADLTRAVRLARESFERDPQRARSAFVLFLSRFYDKRFDEAFVAARRALELNPNATLYASQIGASYISRGEYARGEALLAPLSGLDRSSAPSFLHAFSALAAFMRGDEERFRALARAGFMENGAIGLILRAIAAHRSDDRTAVRLAAHMLQEKFPGVAADVPAALDRYAFAPEIVAKLMAQWRALSPDIPSH